MTFWRNVLPNILLQGQNAVLVVKKTLQNFYQCCTVNFYYCTALPVICTVLKKQACNIYKYWSYNRNLRVSLFSKRQEVAYKIHMSNYKKCGLTQFSNH